MQQILKDVELSKLPMQERKDIIQDTSLASVNSGEWSARQEILR